VRTLLSGLDTGFLKQHHGEVGDDGTTDTEEKDTPIGWPRGGESIREPGKPIRCREARTRIDSRG